MLGLLCALGARADDRQEARKRFKAGMALINSGQYEQAIEALQEAYSIRPHPNVLFNIARAYEALGKSSDALTYYRRYLDFEPPDSGPTREKVALLEARLPKPQEKPEKPEPPPPREARPAVDEGTLARLEALSRRLEAALTRAERPPPPPSKPAATPPPAARELIEELPEVPYEETVVTASRRAQASVQVPNSTTVITAEEIRLSGARSLPELLRRVPGAEVMAMGASSYNVSFRGFNQRVANKVLLLIDGRTEYQDFLGLTLWPVIPIGVEEIERIEIIRGPGSALYGANAMLGVINVITRQPGAGDPLRLEGGVGNGNQATGKLVASGGTALRYRASAAYEQANKYSLDYAPGRPDVLSAREDPNLAVRTARANLTTHYAFNREVSLSASAGVNRFFTEFYGLGLLRNFFLDGVGGYAKVDAALGPVNLRFFWNHLSGSSGPQYQPLGQRSLATVFASNVFDAEAIFRKEFSLAGTHNFAVGAQGRIKRLSWDYIGALQQQLHGAGFVQDEWRLLRQLSLVASYRLDVNPILNNGQPGVVHSPRVSVVVSPSEGNALHLSFASAFREPTFLESYLNLRTPVPGLNGASVLTTGSLALKPERILAFELGYRGEFVKAGLELDAALYWNVVSDLVSLSAVNPVPAGAAFDAPSQSFLLGKSAFQNDPTAYTARGGELGLKYSAVRGLDFRFWAALQWVTGDAAVCVPCSQAPLAKVGGAAMYRTPVGLDLSVDAAFTSATVWVEREPSPSDPTTIANLSNPLAASVVINARAAYRFLEDRVTLALVATQLGPRHAEHPFGNLVDRRVLATFTVTP